MFSNALLTKQPTMKIYFCTWIILVLLMVIEPVESTGQGGFMKIYPEGYQGTSINHLCEVDGNLYAVMSYVLVKSSFAIVKMDTMGNILSKKEYQDTEYNYLIQLSCQISKGGSIYVKAVTYDAQLLLKFDLSGHLLHRVKYPLPEENRYALQCYLGNGEELYLVNYGKLEDHVIKLDLSLNEVWTYTIKRQYVIDPYEFNIYDITLDQNNNVNVFAYANMGYRGEHLLSQYNYRFFYKINNESGKLFKKVTIEDTSWSYSKPVRTNDGKYVMFNHVPRNIHITLKEFGSDFQSPRDILINTLTNRDWHTDYLETLMYDDKMDEFGIHAIGTSFSGFLFLIEEAYGNYVAKLNRDFSKKWEVRDTILYHPTNPYLYMKSYMSPSGSIYIYGDFSPSVAFLQYNYCAFIRKYDTNGCLTPECQNIVTSTEEKYQEPEQNNNISIDVFPNPTTLSSLYVSIQDPNENNYRLQLLSIDGHIVYEGSVKGSLTTEIEISHLNSGTYLLQTIDQNPDNHVVKMETKKIIIQK